MIEVEGYKAFKGIMQVTPKDNRFPLKMLTGDFLYKPEFNCWYNKSSSYPADICEVIKDETV